MNTNELSELAHALVKDESANLEQGYSLRFSVEPDDLNPLDDMGEGTWSGRVEEVAFGRTQPAERPEGFNGRARKIQNGFYWWQPPESLPDCDLDKVQGAIENLLNYGYCAVIVELLHATEAHGAPMLVETSAVGGVEPFRSDDDMADIVTDLLAELLADRSNLRRKG